MNNPFNNDFKKSLYTGFIDSDVTSTKLYRPKLLVNRKIPKEKVLSSILSELDNCEEFFITVAFVTNSGVAVLLNSLMSLEKKGIKGKVLVSQYLNFTEPEALRRILHFKNIELKILTNENAHSKGYIFKRKGYYNLIVGSSNLTANALTINKEWNVKVSGLSTGTMVDQVLNEFKNDFEVATAVSNDFINKYQRVYERQRLINRESTEISIVNELIKPNSMQVEALRNLIDLRRNDKNKALIISATGTGKTYLSAFDVKAFNPKKMLFVVHRLNIALKALETYKKLFKGEKSLGVYSGKKKELEADFIFSTVQTISKKEYLSSFSKEEFDYIIIDESHRSGAESYQRLIDYFNPRFLLGMTATPERTDGNDIFKLFDYNIAYEIRLNRAMEEGMLSQFHYYGITDLQIDGETIEETKKFNLLTTQERVDRIIEKAKYYGTDSGVVRGLVFCSRNDESKELSLRFNENGFKTISLSGDNTEEERSQAILRLESDDINNKLDYIFTVDIFNEGIDIPKINQILMIRPTDSAIIFVQQLGRGLRKSESKDYLTIIDFIGNHKNNYLIPIALYGDTSYNKDTLRKLMSQGSNMIPGASTINFDEITKESIFSSIDSVNMKILSELKKDYYLLKFRLGRTPMMLDFLVSESRDPFLYVEYSKSYFNFVRKVDKEFKEELKKKSSDLLELFSKEINNSKRVEESTILLELMLNKELRISSLKERILNKYNFHLTDETITSCILNINFDFIRKGEEIIFEKNGILKFYDSFWEKLKNETFYKFLMDSVLYSIKAFENSFSESNYDGGLIRYNKYSRKDVCRLLNWEKDISSTVYGYRTRDAVTPCFVTYNKSENIDDTIKYNDHFITPTIFAWESRSNRKIESAEIKNVIDSNRILLFVKKEDGEGTDFYFMGDVNIVQNSIEQSVMSDSSLPVVHFKFELEKPVPENLYNYITAKMVNIEEEMRSGVGLINDNSVFTIPLFDFYAAAGSFSEMQNEKDYVLIEVEEKYTLTNDYFACKVIGESMNKRIPNGSICIFRKYNGGTRNGKIVLVENRDIHDQDFNSSFTVKTYLSKKVQSNDSWKHSEIILSPNSYDESFNDIVINEENSTGMKILGEFVCVLSR